MSESLSSTAPTRKRRRPALSCEQCRRRKIKCDRDYPCGQCLQSRTVSCSYSPSSAGMSRHVNDTTSTAFLPVQSSIGIPNRARSIPSSSSTHVSSIGLSPTSVSLSSATHPSLYSSPISAPGESHQEETLDSKVLLDRIRKLEAQLAISKSELAKSEQMTTLSSSIPNSTPELRGTVSKTRFFGTSHWMYSYETVCYQFSRT